MDLHISVIADLKDLLQDRWDITDWCLSGHSWVFARNQQFPEVIHPKTWIQLNPEMIRDFQAKYDDFLRGFDGFICGHPNGFAMLFEKYDKPILMVNTCRYDLPFCISKNRTMLQEYRACLHRLQARGRLIAVSNNRADQLYTRLNAGIETTYIPSLCAYTGMRYAPTRSTFLFYNTPPPSSLLLLHHPLITHKSALGCPYSWADIGTFRGIIYWPYEVSTMSMFEHFTANMPMFFPSQQMESELTLQSLSAYWGSTRSCCGDLPRELQDVQTWIDHADWKTVFSASPNVYFYDSWPHLFELLENFVWNADDDDREPYRQGIRDAWTRLLQEE